MAIDSAEKRRSASTVVAGIAPPSVTPSATKGQTWRQDAGWGYYGILAEAATIATWAQPAPALIYRSAAGPLRYRTRSPELVYRPRTHDPLEVV